MDLYICSCKEVKRSLGALFATDELNDHELNGHQNESSSKIQKIYEQVSNESFHCVCVQQATAIPDDRVENKSIAAQISEQTNILSNQYACAPYKQLTMMFGQALFETATPFAYFDHPSLALFFSSLNGLSSKPTANVIGGSQLQEV